MDSSVHFPLLRARREALISGLVAPEILGSTVFGLEIRSTPHVQIERNANEASPQTDEV
jgi:hypothetical protein